MHINERLKAIMAAGEVNTRNMAIWLGLPYSTVWFWLQNDGRGVKLPPSRKRDLERRLALIETAIVLGRLPAPVAYRQRQRTIYLKALYNELEHSPISAGDTTN